MKTGSASAWSALKRKSKKVLLMFFALFVILMGIFIYWKYFYIYSDGYRAGLLQKFSHKGTFIKTWEGEMILSSVSGNMNVVIASEKFYFSVLDEILSQQLDTIQGRMVIVHYQQRNGVTFWRGDSKYLVDSVKLINH